MIVIEKIKPKALIRNVDEISCADALIIGVGQCFALISGVSRSGATMLSAMMKKIDVKTYAHFSFLISVPVITIATVYVLLKSLSQFCAADGIQLVVGFIVSFIVAVAAIKLFLAIFKKSRPDSLCFLPNCSRLNLLFL